MAPHPPSFSLSICLSFLPSFALPLYHYKSPWYIFFPSLTLSISYSVSYSHSAPPAEWRNSLSWKLGRKLYDMPVRNVNVKWSIKIIPGANLTFRLSPLNHAKIHFCPQLDAITSSTIFTFAFPQPFTLSFFPSLTPTSPRRSIILCGKNHPLTFPFILKAAAQWESL